MLIGELIEGLVRQLGQSPVGPVQSCTRSKQDELTLTCIDGSTFKLTISEPSGRGYGLGPNDPTPSAFCAERAKTLGIKPTLKGQTSRQGGLSSALSAQAITDRLGFGPNVVNSTHPSGDGKVTQQWQWRYNGRTYAIWDYKGSRWSCYGDLRHFESLFGASVLER